MNISFFSNLFLWLLLITLPEIVFCQSADFIIQDVKFESQGVTLAGSILTPRKTVAAVVIVHGSDPVKREMDFAIRLAKEGIAVLTYDKRGVGESGGIYVGPSVGTNNIDTTNLNLLSHDASSAVNTFRTYLKDKKIPIGLVGFSQAGWIIPIAASKNPKIEFMVLFSCPTITTLEQLRFQFYTNGNNNFWENHTESDARQHTKNDPDRYQFVATDPKIYLNTLSIPGLWLFGEKDIQIPVKLCIEQLNTFKAQGKPFEYTLFSKLGHNTAFDNDRVPVDISIQWIKQKTFNIKKSKVSK
ncbi:alpha/beta hydrolase family protein [Flavobacterium gawalongense]|uniref:Alpha/beta hydrolase n=1 Tax=Flavobacterium gawalongense TaxID=2594432 RepID=A0ABY3CPY7_9FLAO|nr:alpha/beta hydrolase [Flavobacterium gawalongense]TRW99028.1 alpha/beta hydrolase [Flavobacterium gawalongense]TRX09907.1 alpha/beta hydrolase [Flavobacterium gawalongense]